MHRLFKDELLQIDKYSREARLLGRNNIETEEDLEKFMEGIESKMTAAIEKRTELRRVFNRVIPESEKEKLKEEMKELTKELRELRSELKLCEDVRDRSGIIEEKLYAIDIERNEMEVKDYEPIR